MLKVEDDEMKWVSSETTMTQLSESECIIEPHKRLINWLIVKTTEIPHYMLSKQTKPKSIWKI